MGRLIGRLLAALYARHEAAIDRWLAKLEARGRKKVLLSFEADVAAQRWYLLYLEKDEDPRLVARFPNAYLHKDLNIQTPGSAHGHAWNSYSFILRGAYTELVDGVERTHQAGDVAVLKYTEHHEITRCAPGTVTLFVHGWRRAPWRFRVGACDKLCDRCATNYGACVNTIKTTPYALNAADGGGAWKRTTWFSTQAPGLERRIRVRQRALAQGKVRARILTRDEVLARSCRENQL